MAAVLVLLAISGASYPGADLVAWTTRLRGAGVYADAPSGTLAWLHVAHPAGGVPFIADPLGRHVILRGAVIAGLVDWWSGTDPSRADPPSYFPVDPGAYTAGCPANSDLIRVPPVCSGDFVQMRHLGFTVVRLGLSWSLLEPAPGRNSQLYLDRIAQVVGWARQNGIYVILDLHEDGYSRFLPRPLVPVLPGGTLPALNDHDGAPASAVYTWGLPSERFFGQREVNPAVGAATTAFWLDWAGIQEQYLEAVADLARRFRDDSTVAGYNLYNEPWPGFVDPPLFEDLLLLPFYRRAIDALTGVHDGLPCPGALPLAICGHVDLGVDTHQLIFVEADHLREIADFDLNLSQPLSSYPNVVYAMHGYTHKFSLDTLAGWSASTYPPGGYDTSYRSAAAAARSLDAAVFVTEFGNEPELDPTLLARQSQQQERYLVGSTYWPWKENCDRQTTWGIYQGVFGTASDQRCAYDSGSERAPSAPQSGCLRASKERLLARVWPRAFAGTVSYRYDPATGSFSLRGSAPPGSQDTVVSIPPEVAGAVSITGASVRQIDEPDGSRLVDIRPTGPYSMRLGPAPLRLAGCV